MMDAPASEQRADPDEDVLGWENGRWHNESIAVNQSDGLNTSERQRFVNRSMARVEFLREAEFDEPVPVEIHSRSEFQSDTESTGVNRTHSRWNNQVWEALFITDEQTNVTSELKSNRGSGTAGYYSPRNDSIVIITETPEQPVIDNATLIHELEHALQDQTFDLSKSRYEANTQDGSLGVSNVVEGDANYVEALYTERCQGPEWDCVETPEQERAGTPDLNYGIFVTQFQPYSDGPHYVHTLHQAGGWDLVDTAFRNPPSATETGIHATRSNETDQDAVIQFEDTATNGWNTFPQQGVDGADTLGEASMYAMFWYEDFERGHDIIDWLGWRRTVPIPEPGRERRWLRLGHPLGQ